MANHRWSRPTRISVVALALLSASCTDAPVVPAPVTADDLHPANYYSTYDGAVVSLVDEDDGEVYTLNTDTREIRRGSDGAVLLLDAEQAAAAATAFYGNVVADAVLNSFVNVCSPENPCGAEMNTPVGDSLVSGLILRKESEGAKTRRGSTFGASFRGNTPSKPFRTSHNGIDLMYGDVCSDIVNAVFQSRLDYRSHRTSFLKEGFMFAVALGGGLVTRSILPAGGFGAVRFMGKIAEGADRRIAVSILGFMWNSNYCGNGQTVNAGPVIRSFGGGGGGNANNLVCHDETWSISFDGGNKFTKITVEVCEYAQS